jgi:CRISPR-associated protein Csm4
VKLYEVVIKPDSRFGTPLKGDTIFGHFIWQLVLDETLLKRPLDEVIQKYKEKPFIVFSSAFPKLYVNREDYFFLKRPELPLNFFEDKARNQDVLTTIKNRKQQKKKKYLRVKKDLKLICIIENLFSEKEIFTLYKSSLFEDTLDDYPESLELACFQMHNKINRLTLSTGEGFAPYNQIDSFYLPGMELSLFVLFDEAVLDIEMILAALEKIGLMGFGRDASSGLGRFSLGEEQELALPDFSDCQALYTLSPCVPEGEIKKVYFHPFVRFGRHGSFLATSSNPFKNPVLMMDEGAVLMTEELPPHPFIGKALTNLSKAEDKTVGQGYSIVLPLYFNFMET